MNFALIYLACGLIGTPAPYLPNPGIECNTFIVDHSLTHEDCTAALAQREAHIFRGTFHCAVEPPQPDKRPVAPKRRVVTSDGI